MLFFLLLRQFVVDLPFLDHLDQLVLALVSEVLSQQHLGLLLLINVNSHALHFSEHKVLVTELLPRFLLPLLNPPAVELEVVGSLEQVDGEVVVQRGQAVVLVLIGVLLHEVADVGLVEVFVLL
jgi:hypothetical protein